MIEFRLSPLPADLLRKIGSAVARAHSDRIRNLHETVDGAPIDANADGWREAKESGETPLLAISSHPLTYTGTSTDGDKPFEVDVTGDDTVVIRFSGPAREAVQSVIEQSEVKGNNWKDAYGVGHETDKAAAMIVVADWLDGGGKLVEAG